MRSVSQFSKSFGFVIAIRFRLLTRSDKTYKMVIVDRICYLSDWEMTNEDCANENCLVRCGRNNSKCLVMLSDPRRRDLGGEFASKQRKKETTKSEGVGVVDQSYGPGQQLISFFGFLLYVPQLSRDVL